MKAFYQADFEGGNAKVGALEEETSDSSVLLDLKAGDLVVDVKKLRKKSNFEISTPVGVAGIRGTTFKLIASAESTTLSVLTGRVDFVSSSKESFQVEASQGVLAPKGGTPKVSPLTEVQKQAIKATVDKARAKADEVDIGTLKDGLGFKNHLVPSASNLEMIWVEPGTFMMGSPPAEEGRNGDETRHRVTLTTGFYLGKHEVTQAQYKAVTGLNPSKYKAENRPVENVRWGDAFRFCSKLTNREQNAGTLPMNWKYALPTEAEWEYACRAGTSTVFSFGNRLTPGNASFTDIQPYGGNATGTKRGKTLEVGKFAPNPWGFHDMHGNVWEWVADIYRPFSNEVAIDPQGGPPGAIRVRRGGAFNGPASTLRSSNRKSQKASNKIFSLGFRLALKKAK